MPVAVVSSTDSRVGDGFAAQGFGEFQIAPGGGVELHEIAVALGLDGLNMRQRSALRVLDVVEQGACGGKGQGQVGHAETR